MEIEFCGHATLATAYVIFGRNSGISSITFYELKPYDVTVTAPSRDHDCVSRYFWPANGGDEDPVTGSIHTGLAPFWSKRLRKQVLRAYQASKRGGVLLCKVDGDRVIILGKAVRYLSGFIEI